MPPAYEILLLNTAIPQIQAAQSGDTYVVPRDIAFSAALTLSAGTPNGVPYLNGSKVVTTNSALSFNGTNLAIGAGGAINSYRPDNATYTTQYMGAGGTGGYVFDNINADGFRWLFAGSEQMRLNSTGLGIGTTNPGAKLQVQVSGATTTLDGLYVYNGTAGGIFQVTGATYSYRGIGSNQLWIGSNGGNDMYIGPSTANVLKFGSNAYEYMTLDSSGNLGLGVTPSANWGSGLKALQIGPQSAFFSGDTAFTAATRMTTNVYSTAGSAFYRIGSGFATSYYQQSGLHVWETAASGTANSTTIVSGNQYIIVTAGGNFTAFGAADNNVGTVFTATSSGTATGGGATQAIVFTQAMTLDASGNLVVGDTAATTGAKIDALGRVMSSNSNNDRIVITQAGRSVAPTLLDGGTALFGLGNGAAGITVVGDGVSVPLGIGTYGNEAFILGTNNTEKARITSGGEFQVSSGGSVQVGGTAARATTAGTNRLDIFNGTAPVGTLTNGISIYSSSGEAYVMDAAGNATLFSPHDAETNEWIFKSKHTPTGKVLKIDVERLLKFVNDHFGLDAVHEFVEE